MTTEAELRKESEKELEAEGKIKAVPKGVDQATVNKIKAYAEQEKNQVEGRIQDLQTLRDKDYVSGQYTDVKHVIEVELERAHKEKLTKNGGQAYLLSHKNPRTGDTEQFKVHPDGSIDVYVPPVTDSAGNVTTAAKHTPVDGFNILNIDIENGLKDKAHPASAALVEETLNIEATKKGYTDHLIDEYNDAQLSYLKTLVEESKAKEIADKIHFLDLEAEKTKDQDFTPQKFIRDELRKAGASEDQTSQMMMDVIWAQELNRRDAIVNPSFSGLAYSSEFSGFQQRVAVLDILNYASAGETTHTMDDIAPDVQPIDDHLFKPDFYKKFPQGYLYDGQTVKATMILSEDEIIELQDLGFGLDEGGKPIDPQHLVFEKYEVQDIARIKFENAAISQGIAPQDITQAMFEGRFNIPFDDVQNLVWEGLSQNIFEDIALTDTSSFGSGGNNAKIHDQAWNARYGAIKDINSVETYAGSELKTMSGEDIIFRSFMRGPAYDGATSGYAGTYGALRDEDGKMPTDITLAEARAKLASDPKALALMEKKMDDIREDHSAVTFFRNSGRDGLNPQADYARLREHGQYKDNINSETALITTKDAKGKEVQTRVTAQEMRDDFKANGKDLNVVADELNVPANDVALDVAKKPIAVKF